MDQLRKFFVLTLQVKSNLADHKNSMTSLAGLISRLEALDRTLGPSDEQKQAEDANLDEFTRTKKEIARQVAGIRKVCVGVPNGR
jgi:hypothetical protein